MFGETSAIGGDGQVQDVRSGDEIDSILELEGDDDILAQFDTAPKAAGSGSGWTPGGSGSGWTPGGGSAGSGWTPGGSGGGETVDAAEKKKKKKKKKQESANRVGAGSVGGTGRSERGGTAGPSSSTWAPAPFGGSSGAAAPAPTGMGSGLSGSSYREAQRASQKLASSASSLSSSRQDTGPTGIGRSSYTRASTQGTSAASRAPTQTAEEVAAEIGIDMDDEDSFHAPAPAPTPAPAPAPQRLNVHFGIDALEAAEPEAVDESYGDDAFEVSGTENFEDDFEDESFEVVEEDPITISAEDKSTPAPAPAPARSNVHFGIAGLEMPDEVPEPAPAPYRAAAPAPAHSKIGGSNVHFGIAGLEEMSDDAVPAEAESIASGSNSNAISMSMDSLQVCARSDFYCSELWSLKVAVACLLHMCHWLNACICQRIRAGAVEPRHR